jgi:uncharacterized protein (DUF1697 family)
MPIQIALLRGINVGAHKRIAMADLRELLSALGYDDAHTLLQSGNVVLTANARPEQLAQALERAIAGKLGVDTPVVVRTRAQLAAIAAHNPLAEVATEPKLYQVSFLSAKPNTSAMRELAALDLAPERFVHHGREIYAWHPNGIQRSPLAKLLTDKRLGVTVTARNWNTVGKLLELADTFDD